MYIDLHRQAESRSPHLLTAEAMHGAFLNNAQAPGHDDDETLATSGVGQTPDLNFESPHERRRGRERAEAMANVFCSGKGWGVGKYCQAKDFPYLSVTHATTNHGGMVSMLHTCAIS